MGTDSATSANPRPAALPRSSQELAVAEKPFGVVLDGSDGQEAASPHELDLFSFFLSFPFSFQLLPGSTEASHVPHIASQQAQRGDNETFYMKSGENLYERAPWKDTAAFYRLAAGLGVHWDTSHWVVFSFILFDSFFFFICCSLFFLFMISLAGKLITCADGCPVSLHRLLISAASIPLFCPLSDSLSKAPF